VKSRTRHGYGSPGASNSKGKAEPIKVVRDNSSPSCPGQLSACPEDASRSGTTRIRYSVAYELSRPSVRVFEQFWSIFSRSSCPGSWHGDGCAERGVVLAELAPVGIKPLRVETTGSGHVRIAWQACPEKAPREVVVVSTGSDRCGKLNARALVRRMLKADNVSLSETIKRTPKTTTLDKALSVPTETPSLIDEVRALRVIRT